MCRLAAQVHNLRFGDDAAGLAAGQGLTLMFCPSGAGGFDGGGFLVIPSTGDPCLDEEAAVEALARSVLIAAGERYEPEDCRRLAAEIRALAA